MASGRFRGILIVSLSLYVLSGCAHVISSDIRQKANPTLTFSEVRQNPVAYKGSTVIWGGEIINTINQEQATDIIILQIPLNREERPIEPTQSQGRFIARSLTFLDPAIYKPGRKITVAGEVVSEEKMALGKMEYTYPVVQIKEIHVWRRVLVEYPQPYYGWGWGWRWGWGWPGPYYPPTYYEYEWQ